jgi:hypothetical protein
MRAFIVRPFGVKERIDFDRVERELIQPALARLKESGLSVQGGTTGEITRQGNDEAFAATEPPRPTPDRVILFTSHMIDAPTRTADRSRFPATEQAEAI